MGELNRDSLEKRKGIRIISITSGKGGVGKSSILINIALTLAKKGNKVLVLDADLGLSNVDVMLGLKPEKDISHFFNGDCKLDDIILKGPYGIRLIPGGSGFSELASLTHEQKLILLSEIENIGEEVDYLLIDTPAGIGQNVMFFNSCAVEVIVVVNPEPTSITDSYALIKVLSKNHNVKTFSLLINNVATSCEATRVYKKLSDVSERFLNVSLNFLGFLPFDRMITTSIKEQNPIMNRGGVTPYSSKLKLLCHKLDNMLPEKPLNGNVQFFFKRIIELSDREISF